MRYVFYFLNDEDKNLGEKNYSCERVQLKNLKSCTLQNKT